jgi:hypothetical protein
MKAFPKPTARRCAFRVQAVAQKLCESVGNRSAWMRLGEKSVHSHASGGCQEKHLKIWAAVFLAGLSR